MQLEWDEAKRLSNLAKHGLDFANAAVVLESRYQEVYFDWLKQEDD